MRFPIRFQSFLSAALGCAAAFSSFEGKAADPIPCKTGDEPNVVCFYRVGDWGCNGPCAGGNYGPVTVFMPPAGYQVCRSLITRQETQGGECFFSGGPTEAQLVCTAPNAGTQARVREITFYAISKNATREQLDKYKCVAW